MRPSMGEACGRWGLRVVVGVALALGGCTVATHAMVPRIGSLGDEEGFKLLKPNAGVRRCEGSWRLAFGSLDDGMLDAAFQELLALDPEANAILHARAGWEWRSIGVYGWRCVSLEGDLVRMTSTVMLPMGGAHGGHH